MTVALAPLLAGQLAVLKGQSPEWELTVESFDAEHWFTARRRACAGTSCGCCTVVAGTTGRLRNVLIAGSGPGSGQPPERMSRR